MKEKFKVSKNIFVQKNTFNIYNIIELTTFYQNLTKIVSNIKLGGLESNLIIIGLIKNTSYLLFTQFRNNTAQGRRLF